VSDVAAGFSGSVPQNYDRYLGPVLFEPYAADLVARVPATDGLRVLELACGTGILTRRLRAALPESATLVATDLNPPMVDYARDAVAAPGIDWRQADMQQLAFDDDAFDVVLCQFGFMFLPDKVRGFAEARRVLAPGGVLLVNVWQSLDANHGPRAINSELARLFPDDPPRFMETPHSYHDKDRIRADMAEAGWENVRLDEVALRGCSPSAIDFATGFTLGSPLTQQLVARGADTDAVIRALTAAVIPVGGEKPFELQHGAIVITANA
jgi:SAM-dependent methyltransferase